MFYKIKALADAGITITLHYFKYKSGRNTKELEQFCDRIIAYKRHSFFGLSTFSKPYIVASRINQTLIKNLNSDDDPIVFDGIHCTGVLPYLKREQRKIIVRLHNDEAIYYDRLATSETSFYKKMYYRRESQLLNKYQQELPNTVTYITLSQDDANQFRKKYKLDNVTYIPAFVPWQKVNSKIGFGSYCLYHGNLAIAENESAALWLIEKIFAQIEIPFIIAGSTFSLALKKATAPFKHIQFYTEPSEEALESLIQEAHIHVLPDLNKTGVKLKLLHGLFCGRFCITNATGFEHSNSLSRAETPQDYITLIKSKMNVAFTLQDIDERKRLLAPYDNRTNAEKIITHLY